MRLFKKILLSILFTVGFFAAVETILFFIGVGESWSPFEQERDADSWVAKLTPTGAFHFHSDRFPVDKPANTFRVFTFGGSSTYGYPFARSHSRSSFPGMMRVLLETRHPEQRIEVINCGSPGMDSRTSLEVLQAALDYSPDALVVYSGHNEFLPQNVSNVKRELEKPFLDSVLGFAKSLRLFGLMRSMLASSLPKADGGVQFNDLVQYDKMIAQPLCTAEETAAIHEKYGENLTAMCEAARDADVPIFLCLPVSNLKDFEPNVSYRSRNIDATQLKRFDDAFAEGRTQAEAKNWTAAIESFQKANRADPNVAESHYQLANAFEQSSDHLRARPEYLRARDLDGRPLRATAAILDVVTSVAREQDGATLIDSFEAMEQAAENGIVGNPLIIDNVHPTLEGDYVLARAVVDALSKAGLPGPSSGENDPSFEECLRKTGSKPALVTEGLAEAGLYLLRFVPMRWDRDQRAARTEEVFQQVLEQQPDNIKALHGLGTLYLMIGRSEDGQQIIRSTLEKQPDSAKLIHHFAKLSPYLTKLYREAKIPLEEE
ncbi:MAG: hypothetical protein RL885_19370 [Planctomycetota bacterium]